MKCKWYFDHDYACANSTCPYGGDTCPTREHPEVCKYAEEKPKPELNAEELVTALRLCAGATCEGCPCMCNEELVGCNNYVKRKAADMLEKLAAKKDEKKPEWINAKNKLPERDRKVLVIDGHNGIRILAFWRKNGNEWEWITETYGISRKNDVKMWMPLPEPPKEETHD